MQPEHALDALPEIYTRALRLDAHVLARFRDGDPEAVARVYRAYGRLVHAVAYKVLGDRGLSEEATQRTFVKAWRAASRIDPEREIDGWLVTIAQRVAIDIYRRESRRAAVSLGVVSADDLGLAASGSAPEDCIEVWEVRRAVSQLPADEREIVRLQHFGWESSGRPFRHALLILAGETPDPDRLRPRASRFGRFGELVHVVLVTPQGVGLGEEPNHFTDANLRAHDRYGARAGRLMLVRPDGTSPLTRASTSPNGSRDTS